MCSLSKLNPRITAQLPLVALLALGLWPLARMGPPLTNRAITDGPNHFYRVAVLLRHLAAGDLYPRWFSDLHFGFGAPVLNFYAPLSYYVTAGLTVVTQSLPWAFWLSLLLAVTAGAVGMSVWISALSGQRRAGWLAAAAFLFNPYLYFSVLDRGALPEVWALGLVPWLFWAAQTLSLRPGRGPFALTMGLTTALVLTHNLSAVLFGPIVGLAALLTTLSLTEPWPVRGKRLLNIALAGGLGGLLAAFFWLPFLFEAQWIQLERSAVFEFSASYFTPQTLLAWPTPFAAGNVWQPQAVSLALPAVALAVLGVLRPTSPTPRVLALGLGFAAIAFSVGALDLADGLWRAVPFDTLLQFPFRLLGPASLLIAALAGLSLGAWPERWQSWAAGGAMVMLFTFTLPDSFHVDYDPFPRWPEQAEIYTNELTYDYRVGTTNLEEFLPRTVAEWPDRATIAPALTGTDPTTRYFTLPNAVTVVSQRLGIAGFDLTYHSPTAFDLTIAQFYFPGWAARLDGQPLGMRVRPDGRMQVALPAGAHTVTLTRQPTFAQILGALVSGLALMVGGVLVRHTPRAAPIPTPSAMSPNWALVPLVLLALRIIWVDTGLSPFAYDGRRDIAQPMTVVFGNEVALIGVTGQSPATLTPGGTASVTLFWQAARPIGTNYQVTVQVYGSDGLRYAQSDVQTPGQVPMRDWRPTDYARDGHTITLPPDAPPGDYQVQVGVYEFRADGSVRPLDATDANGTPLGQLAAVLTLRVSAAP